MLHHTKDADQTAPTAGFEEWRRGWTLVLAGFLGFAVGTLTLYPMGVFVKPLEAEFGWSRTQVTAGLSLFSLIGLLFSPVIGLLVDRWGARTIALPGITLFCLCFGLLSLTSSEHWMWMLLWSFFAISALGTKPTIWSTAIASAFDKQRGLALGIMLCGTGASAAMIPTLTSLLIDTFGWRGAYQGLALIYFIVIAPIIFLFFHDPRRNLGAQSDKKKRPTSSNVGGWSLAEGLRKRQFYQLVSAALIVTSIAVAFSVHMAPLLTETGLDRASAVAIVGAIGIMSIVGRLLSGFLFDRTSAVAVASICLALPVLASAIFLSFPGSVAWSVAGVLVVGLYIGAEFDALIYLSSRYFGMKNFGSLFGFISSATLAGVGLGPNLASMLYDLNRSYDQFLWLCIPFALASCVLILTLGPYP